MIFRSFLVGFYGITSHMTRLFQENYCDALRQVYNETSLREVDINHLLEISIASDVIGGGGLKLLFFSYIVVNMICDVFGIRCIILALETSKLCLCVFKTTLIRAYGFLFLK